MVCLLKDGLSCVAAARIAATVLTRAAIDRGSRDNVTVVVVDLASKEVAGKDDGGAGGRSAGDHDMDMDA